MRSPISKAAPAPNCSSAPPLELPLDTVTLARFLIGKILVRTLPAGALSGRIVETEAYLPGDPASHAFRGETPRNRSMFGAPGRAYVYLIYGRSHCLNVTSEAAGLGAAVLIRALEPLTGATEMQRLRGRPGLRVAELARGPGNLCRALAIDRALDGIDLLRDPRLALADDGARPAIGTSVRIGISQAAERELRFYARGSPAVSGRRALSP